MTNTAYFATPPYRIETERTVLRCWQPTDAPLLKAAIDASLDHLRPWMPWAMSEPEDVSYKVARLRRWRANFDLDKDYIYGIFNQDESAVLGGTGLHTRLGKNAFEIGYWIHADYINRGLATEISAALTRVAFSLPQIDRVEIHCDPDNVRSASVPRKLGYRHEATLRRRAVRSDGQPRDTMLWSIFAHEFAKSPAASVQVRLYDILGAEMTLNRPIS
ncbi:MAG: GNAT family N-acetyltransferase [Caldilineaceae bacterium]|nr:GNAT family N-acetyltransferase [Caldilineaceae bacterium]